MDRQSRIRQGSYRGNLTQGRSSRVAVSEVSFAARFDIGQAGSKYTRLHYGSHLAPSVAGSHTERKGDNSEDDLAEQEAAAIFKWVGPGIFRKHREEDEFEWEELCPLLSDTDAEDEQDEQGDGKKDDGKDEDELAEMEARELFRWIGPNPFIQEISSLKTASLVPFPSCELLVPLLSEDETEECLSPSESCESLNDSGLAQTASPTPTLPRGIECELREEDESGRSPCTERVAIKASSSMGVLCVLYGSVSDLDCCDEDSVPHSAYTSSSGSNQNFDKIADPPYWGMSREDPLPDTWSVTRSASAPAFSCSERDAPNCHAFAYEHRGWTQSLSSVTLEPCDWQDCLYGGSDTLSVSAEYSEVAKESWAYDNEAFRW